MATPDEKQDGPKSQFDLAFVRKHLDKSVTLDKKLRPMSGAYLRTVKPGRGGRCMFYLDIPCGMTQEMLGPGGKALFNNLVNIFSGDILFPEFIEAAASSAYPGLWGDFMGYTKGFIIAAAEYKAFPELYGEHDLNSPLHVECKIGFTHLANFNIVGTLLSPRVDAKGKRIVLMEAVLNLMMADMLDLYAMTAKSEKIDMVPNEDWFLKKMARKPPVKPLIVAPFEVIAGAYQYDVDIRWKDVDQNRHANNAVYIGLAQDAIQSAIIDNALPFFLKSDVDLGFSYCRVLYMAQCKADQWLNISLWDSGEYLEHKTPLKEINKLDSTIKNRVLLCSMSAEGVVCCQLALRFFNAQKLHEMNIKV